MSGRPAPPPLDLRAYGEADLESVRARRGLASLLVRDAEARVRALGYRRIIVRNNVNAVPLYAKLGYRTVREGDMACRHLAAFASTSRVLRDAADGRSSG